MKLIYDNLNNFYTI